MSRVKGGIKRIKRRRRLLRRVRGFVGSKKNLVKHALMADIHAGADAYRDRRRRKRDFRRLWQVKINAAARELNMSYSELIGALKNKGVALNRRMLAILAEKQPTAFLKLIDFVR